MRVLHLIKALERGGAEVLLLTGLSVADRDRFDFRYGCLLAGSNPVADGLRALGAEVEAFGFGGNAAMVLGAHRVARHLRAHGVDLVHAHLPVAGIVARLAGRLAGVPVVYTEHNVPKSYHPLVQRGAALTWQWQDCVVAISDDVASAVETQFGASVPIRTVWNGVDTQSFLVDTGEGDAIRRRLGIDPGAPVVGTVCRLRSQKRIDVWLETAKAIAAERPDARFLIVGDGDLRTELEALSERLGLTDVVHFVGAHDDVRPYLAALDVFLMTSSHEGFGLAPVEAMVAGVPVVATNVAGVRNVVEDGVTGCLVDFDAEVVEALTRAVLPLLDPSADRERRTETARDRAVSTFGVGRMQRELESLYEEVLASRRRAG